LRDTPRAFKKVCRRRSLLMQFLVVSARNRKRDEWNSG